MIGLFTSKRWPVRFSLIILLGLLGAVGAAACTPPGPVELPTPLVLPTEVHTAVSTVIPPSPTRAVLTQPPLLPTATRLTSTPRPSPTATPEQIVFESLSSELDTLAMALHEACTPQTTRVHAVIRSVAPLAEVTLNWTVAGRFSSRPGTPMSQTARADWEGELGPFDEMGEFAWWISVRDTNGQVAVSESQFLTVEGCQQSPPTELPTVGPRPSATPFYGEELSVQAVDQQVLVMHNTPTQIILSWEGGMAPFTLDNISRPGHGSLGGTGAAQMYIPNPGYVGVDSFTFRVVDGNDQASTGTITLQVLPPAS